MLQKMFVSLQIICYNCTINIKHMAVLTQARQNKIKQHLEIKTRYNKIMKDPESQKYGAYELLSKEYGYSTTTIGRIVGNIKRKTS